MGGVGGVLGLAFGVLKLVSRPLLRRKLIALGFPKMADALAPGAAIQDIKQDMKQAQVCGSVHARPTTCAPPACLCIRCCSGHNAANRTSSLLPITARNNHAFPCAQDILDVKLAAMEAFMAKQKLKRLVRL